MSIAPQEASKTRLEPAGVTGLGTPYRGVAGRIEDTIAVVAFCGIVLLPLIEICARRLIGEGIPDSISWVRHLTLWLGFLGAALAARSDRHLSIALVTLLKGRAR